MKYEIVSRTVMVKKTDGGIYPDKWYEPEDYYEVHEVLPTGHSKSVFGSHKREDAIKHMVTQQDLMSGNICL